MFTLYRDEQVPPNKQTATKQKFIKIKLSVLKFMDILLHAIYVKVNIDVSLEGNPSFSLGCQPWRPSNPLDPGEKPKPKGSLDP